MATAKKNRKWRLGNVTIDRVCEKGAIAGGKRPFRHKMRGEVKMELVTIVGQVGFPIAVAAYLLVKFENKLDAFGQAATNLAVKLDAHTDRCIKCREGRPCNACEKN